MFSTVVYVKVFKTDAKIKIKLGQCIPASFCRLES